MSALFALTTFVAAALLFGIQPMLGRAVLPVLGGAPQVWATCLLSFQTMLLLGYTLAHVSSARMGERLGITFPVALIGLAATWSPMPSRAGLAALGSTGNPTTELLCLLFRSSGVPFVAIGMTAPLLQTWYHRLGREEGESAEPYFLYAASNAGSLLALLAYPLVIEPRMGLETQARVWGWGLWCLAGLFLACAGTTWASPMLETTYARRSEAVPLGSIASWFALAAIPSSLLMGVTTHLTTDLAPVPLLWVVPLAIYLGTFINAFSQKPIMGLGVARAILPWIGAGLALVLAVGLVRPWWIPLHLAGLALAGLACHGELVRRRPAPANLTRFYLAISAGGAAGGLFNALVAPLVFDRIAEYPIALVAALCVLAFSEGGPGWRAFRPRALAIPAIVEACASVLSANVLDVDASWLSVPLTMLAAGFTMLALSRWRREPGTFAATLAALMVAGGLATGVTGRELTRHRDFFGVSTVTLAPERDAHRLFHGSTVHGEQFLDPTRRRAPQTYFTREGPMGDVFRVFRSLRAGQPLRVGVTGMGVGTLATYAQPGERWTFLEIDPAIARIASNPNFFTYLADSPAGPPEIVLGDARLGLERRPSGAFDLLVLDAFASDAVPTHLLTREAVAIDRDKVAPGGWLVFNITNRYLDLAPLLAAHAADVGWVCRARVDIVPDRDAFRAGPKSSIWAVLARTEAELGPLAHDDRWVPPVALPRERLWTDDFVDLFGSFRLRAPRPTGRPRDTTPGS